MRCPTCKRDVEPGSRYRPFCSERCKLIDLSKWFDGSYTIPSGDEDEDELDPEDSEKH